MTKVLIELKRGIIYSVAATEAINYIVVDRDLVDIGEPAFDGTVFTTETVVPNLSDTYILDGEVNEDDKDIYNALKEQGL